MLCLRLGECLFSYRFLFLVGCGSCPGFVFLVFLRLNVVVLNLIIKGNLTLIGVILYFSVVAENIAEIVLC